MSLVERGVLVQRLPHKTGSTLALTRVQKDGKGYDISTVRVPSLAWSFDPRYETVMFSLDGQDQIGPQILLNRPQATRFHTTMVELAAQSL